MESKEPGEPMPLDYAQCEPEPSSWPVRLYVAALVWAFFTFSFVGFAQETYRADSQARMRTQVPLLMLAAFRLVWARYRRDRGRGWVFYVVLLVFAAPLWELVSGPLDRLGRSFWDGPLIP